MSNFDAIRNHYKQCCRDQIERRLKMRIIAGNITADDLRDFADDLDALDNLTPPESDSVSHDA